MRTSSTRTGGRSSGDVDGDRPCPPDATPVRATASLDEVRRAGRRAEVRSQLAGIDAAHVEQVRDEPVEPLGLAIDRGGDLAALLGRPLDVGVHQRPGGGPDRRQRRPQVVRDRVEQRRLERVAPPGDLGGRRLALEPVALERAADLVGGRGQDPRLAGVGIAELARRGSTQTDPKAWSPAVMATRYGDLVAARRRTCRRGPGRGRGPTRPARRPAAGAGRRGRPAPAAAAVAGAAVSAATRVADGDPDPRRLGLVADDLGDRPERRRRCRGRSRA